MRQILMTKIYISFKRRLKIKKVKQMKILKPKLKVFSQEKTFLT